jgi:hypothetical protein
MGMVVVVVEAVSCGDLRVEAIAAVRFDNIMFCILLRRFYGDFKEKRALEYITASLYA